MRIATYYDDHRRVGRNDGGPLYVTHNLKKLGHEVLHLIPDAKRLNGFGKFDLNVWCDWGEDGLGNVIDYKPIDVPMPGIYWAGDTHLGYEYRLARAKKVQEDGGTVFCAQQEAVEQFSRDGVFAHLLPHAVEPDAYPKVSAIKSFDVGFIGHVNSEIRIDFLDRMFKEFPNFFFGKRLFEEAASMYGRCRIVLHQSIKSDLAMRPFEVMATSSFLLCNSVPMLHDLFEDGKHLVTFSSFDEAVDKARYYLNHEDEREKIAQAGHEEVMAKHTYRHRVEKILETIKEKELITCP